jgi:hypothetical protein
MCKLNTDGQFLRVTTRWVGLAAIASLALVAVTGAWAQSPANRPNGFGMKAAGSEKAAPLTALEFSEPRVVGGASTTVTLTLGKPAPAGGARIMLSCSNPALVQVPTSVEFEEGETSVSFPVFTFAVDAAESITLRGQYGESSVGANLSVLPPATATLSVSVSPATVTVQQGKSGSATLNVISSTGNPNATFKGCWYRQGKHRYQGVDISVGNPGSYPFNAVLYHGTTCNPNDFADQIGFGELINFGGFGWTFWFTAFGNQRDMSALWYVGEDSSQCVNYETAPNC